MATKTNPFGEFEFTRMMDMTKMMGDFRPGQVDMDSLMASQRRNLEALQAANQLAVEGVQAVARRQTEILRQTMSEVTNAMKDMMTAGSPEEKAARQTELAKEAFERAISNMRELAEMTAKAQNEAADVINKRVAASLDEMKTVIAKRNGKA